MRKTFILVACALCLSGIAVSNTVYAETSPVVTESMAQRNITVYMIKDNGRMVIKTQKRAVYDSDNNVITVDESTYSVSRNPYYGDGSKKGEYPYVAGGLYYFYL